MKKFKFRLDRVASTKDKQVKQKTNELANLIKKLELAKSELVDFKDDLESTQKEIFIRSSQGCPVREVLDYQRFMDKLNLRIQKKKKEIESIEEHIEKMQVLLLEMNKEKKVLEKLKERRHVQYIVEQNREEQKQLDELFNINRELRKIL
jgi:flagellar FliJ protein